MLMLLVVTYDNAVKTRVSLCREPYAFCLWDWDGHHRANLCKLYRLEYTFTQSDGTRIPTKFRFQCKYIFYLPLFTNFNFIKFLVFLLFCLNFGMNRICTSSLFFLTQRNVSCKICLVPS